MAAVTNRLTRIHDAEGTLTTGNIPAGGAGATANTDIYLQGSQSLARRQTTTGTTPAGFGLVDAADNNVSASGSHIGVWVWVTHYSILNVLTVAVGSGTTPATNYKGYDIPLSEYPNLGGWLRAWIDPTQTPSRTAGTVSNSAIRHYGVMCAFASAPGGNAQNLVLDAADFTDGGPALELTGTSGVFQDFVTADENSANQYGVVRRVGGVFNVLATIRLGSSGSPLVFSDSNFSVIFPQQSWVSDTFMGIEVDLQNASTDITLTAGVFVSAGAKRGSFIVTGTAGSAELDGCTFSSLHLITLTSGAWLMNCVFNSSGQITANGATLSGCTIANSTAAVAVTASAATLSTIQNCTFQSAGTGHGLEITGIAGEYTFVGNEFFGYAASDGNTGNEAVYVNIASGTVTLNITSGGSTPSIRTAGATVFVNSNVSVTLTGLKNPSEVRVFNADTTTERSGTGAENVTSGSHTFSVPSGTPIDISILSLGYQNQRIRNYSTTGDTVVPVSQVVDRQYDNP